MPHFRNFTTNNIVNTLPTATISILFYHPRFKFFVQQNPDTIPFISNSIIDHLYPELEPSYDSCRDVFDGWFRVPFKDINCFTHVRAPPHPSEILTLHGVFNLIVLNSSYLSASQIRTLILHVLPV